MLFYNLIKKMSKRKGKDYPLLSKKTEEKQCYHNDICRWKRNISVDVDVFPVKLELQGESFV